VSFYNVSAIGFDLFNTLIFADPETLSEAMGRLVGTLRSDGLHFDEPTFKKTYRSAALQFIEKTRQDGRETHNRFWISEALGRMGQEVAPEDPRIGAAVEAYFSAFYDHCHLIPGTEVMLRKLKESYRLGLLSNFTHGPAGWEIIERLGLRPFFEVVLISGELGYRKPHPMVFEKLVDGLGVSTDRIAFVGDDLEPDILGAARAGLKPVLSTYIRDQKMPLVPGFVDHDPQDHLDPSIPQVSNWDELLALLGVG
jgi:putative hydrolase of the HAD superfamily